MLGLAVAWVLAGILLYLHSAAYNENLTLANQSGLRGEAVSPTPMRRVCPTMYADALVWVRNACAIERGEAVRIRSTDIDNAPKGREVHWNSGFGWMLVGAGKLRQAFTGEPFSVALEESMAWINLPLLLAVILLLTTWVSRRAGLAAGVFLAFAVVGNEDFYSGFGPNYIDHHGVLAVAVLGLVLGAVFMGGGFWRTSNSPAQLLPSSLEAAQRGAIASAVFGAVGMWVSAATLVPAIAIVGFAGVASMLLHGSRASAQGIHCVPELWRLWGKVGALLSLAFYLLEYAPSHFGWRLEVNHPAYAAGWWGGSEIVAQIAQWRCGSGRFRPQWGRLGLAIAGIAVCPVAVAIAGSNVFVVLDPFITRLSRHVAEGITIVQAVKIFGAARFAGAFIWTGVAVLAGLVAWWKVRSADRILLAFCLIAVAAFSAMAFGQLRWSPSASGAQMCLIILSIACINGAKGPLLRWSAIAVAIAGLCLPNPISRITRTFKATRNRIIDHADGIQPVYRDIAAALRASHGEANIVLLASPNASVAVGYYGLFQTVGTLYWENLEGMKAAAAMFSAQSEAEARRLIRERGVTHVLIVSDDNFIGEYFNLLNPPPTKKTVEASFGYGLLVNLTRPLWLESIPYQLPQEIPHRPKVVLLFKTRFGSGEADALYENALDAAGAGRMDDAESLLDRAVELESGNAEFWVAKTNLRLLHGDIEGAARAVAQAVEHAAESQLFTICTVEAARFYERRAHRMAEQLYRRALTAQDDAVTANNLVWLLATSPDDQVRNGEEAVARSTSLVEANRGLTFLNAHAAALAEAGRFEEAAAVAKQALEAGRAEGAEGKLVQLAEKRLARYQAGQPWRE